MKVLHAGRLEPPEMHDVVNVPKSILIQKPFAPAQITTGISQLLNTGDAPLES